MLEIPYQPDRLNFIVDCRHTFGESMRGGIVVLHKLAAELSNLGHNVYMPTKPMYSDKIIEIPTHGKSNNNYTSPYFGFELFKFPLDNTISIYPGGYGNVYNTKYVVRWLLQDTEKDYEDTWLDTDFIYDFANFNTLKLREKKQLTTFDFRFDQMINKNETRNGFCFINHKNTPENYIDILSPFNSTILDGWEQKGAWSFLSEQFNKHEYFLTFDDKTTFCVLAGMCGCKSIILNENKSILPIEFRIKNPPLQFGVSYGLNDISWSNKTIDLVMNNVLQLNQQYEKTVINFVSDMKKIVYG